MLFFHTNNYNENLESNVGDIDDIVNELINKKQVWSIFVFEPFEDSFNDEKVIEYLSSNKTNVLIDISIVDGRANFLINLNAYNKDIYQYLKNVTVHI